MPSNPALEGVPPLDYLRLPPESIADRQSALRLVADSIAQQRQLAARAIILHPAALAVLGAALALAPAVLARGDGDLGSRLMAWSGVVVAYLLAVRYAVSGYVGLAEAFRWQEWAGERDEVVAARYGDEMIGVVVFRLEGPNSEAARCAVKAWAVKLRYRRKGVGTDLLREVVRVAREEAGPDVEIAFATDHANSRLLLAEMFNGGFRRRERTARLALGGVSELRQN